MLAPHAFGVVALARYNPHNKQAMLAPHAFGVVALARYKPHDKQAVLAPYAFGVLALARAILNKTLVNITSVLFLRFRTIRRNKNTPFYQGNPCRRA